MTVLNPLETVAELVARLPLRLASEELIDEVVVALSKPAVLLVIVL